MTTAVMTFRKAGLPAASLKESLQGHQATRGAASTGDTFLRLLKSGEWVYGPENIIIEDDALLAIDPTSIEQGYACWGEGELLGEVMMPAGQMPPPRSEMPDHGPAWQDQVSFRVAIISGEDKGTQMLYKTTAIGGRRAHALMVDAIVAQLDADPGNPVPVIMLGADSYRHKKYGQIYTPIFEIVDWVSLEEEEAPEAPEPEPEPEPAKASRKRRTAAAPKAEEPTPEEAQDASSPAPSRRRRRAA